MKSLFLLLLLIPAVADAQSYRPFEVIMDELLPDPAPSQGLPNYEFVELKNISGKSIQLQNWSLTDSVSTAVFPDYVLPADSFLIVCSTSAAPYYQPYGAVLGVTHFPSLNNNGDWLILKSPAGNIIHAIHYITSWYQDDEKAKGGWSLEMINPHHPCENSNNWGASTAIKGGTPGKENADNDYTTEASIPDLLRATVLDSITVKLYFNKTLDSSIASDIHHYVIDNNIGNPVAVSLNDPLFQQITLTLNSPLQKRTVYKIVLSGLQDCEGNEPGIYNSARFGIPETIDSFDIALNEIVYHPKPGGSEFIEIINRSNKIINLQQLELAKKDNAGNFVNLAPISEESYLFFPQDYLVLTADKAGVIHNYFCQNPDDFIEVNEFPVLPDDGGTIRLLTKDKKVIDEFTYDDSYQSKWISNTVGVSLERVNDNSPTQSHNNWHSAAAEVGYATPTYQNSQFGNVSATTITVDPEIISPDNDGFDDFAGIRYQNASRDAVITITIFNAAGRPVRYLAKNQLLGTSGKFIWNGKGENNNDLPAGVYIIYAVITSSKGTVQHYKHAVSIMKKLD